MSAPAPIHAGVGARYHCETTGQDFVVIARDPDALQLVTECSLSLTCESIKSGAVILVNPADNLLRDHLADLVADYRDKGPLQTADAIIHALRQP